jgi:tetratricopeptide (TPR) repeat protein
MFKINNIYYKLFVVLITFGVYFQNTNHSIVLAQNTNNNPLENPTADPLLPRPSVERPLSPLEEYRLRENLVLLDQEARILLAEGKSDEAFEIWYRELILWQSLEELGEIKALARVGKIAWDNNRKDDVKNINQRLETIENSRENFEPEILKELGLGYESVKNRQKALNIYQIILNQAQINKDIEAEEKALNTIGELHLNWFDYLNAAQTYEDLLSIATQQNNPYNQFIYLEKLAYIYNQSFQTENALKIKQQIAQTFLNNQELEKLARIKIDIGKDYEILEELETASQFYQEAFTLAWGLRQFSIAGDALTELGELYENSGYADYALQIYQELIKVEQHSYNYYGLMTTYEKMGLIYQQQNNYPQAIFMFQKALEIAQSLQYQTAYFQDKIQENYSLNQPEIPNY